MFRGEAKPLLTDFAANHLKILECWKKIKKKLEYLEQRENQLERPINPVMAPGRNRTLVTLISGGLSHYCVILDPQIIFIPTLPQLILHLKC